MKLASSRTGDLSARKFDTVLRIKFLQLPADTTRKQIVHFGTEHAGENKQFEIRHTSLLIFQTCHRLPASVPAKQLQLGGEITLRPSPLLADFPHLRADDVQLGRMFFDAGTLAAELRQSCRLYQPQCEQLSLASEEANR
jgi:hypothetical protein